MLKGREGRPPGSGGVGNRKRHTGEGTVDGQTQWDLWHLGAGRKIRPVRKPEGRSKGQDVLCAQGCSGCGAGRVGKLSGADGTWGWLCCWGEGLRGGVRTA